MIPYHFVMVYDASQVLNADLLPLVNSISYTSHPYEQRSQHISFIGDPYLRPLDTQAQRQRCYHYTNKLSFVERTKKEYSPFLYVLNNILNVRSNNEYHILPDKCAVANFLSNWNI